MASSVRATGQLQNGHSTIFYEQEGSQDGPAILGIHGLGGTTNFFQPIVSSFQDYNVVRFDLSGHGRSAQDAANTKTSIATYVEDAEAIIRHFGLKDVTVLGHSLGGLIALHLAAKIPETVTRLVLFGPVKPPPEAGQNGLRARAKTVRDFGMVAVADTVIGASLSPATLKARPELVGFARELLSRQLPEGYALACEALAESTEPDWSRITAKVAIVGGSDDKVSSPATVESIASNLTATKREVISFEDAGHWHTLENPTGCIQAIEKVFKL